LRKRRKNKKVHPEEIKVVDKRVGNGYKNVIFQDGYRSVSLNVADIRDTAKYIHAKSVKPHSLFSGKKMRV